jgi:hypothetical protein
VLLFALHTNLYKCVIGINGALYKHPSRHNISKPHICNEVKINQTTDELYSELSEKMEGT